MHRGQVYNRGLQTSYLPHRKRSLAQAGMPLRAMSRKDLKRTGQSELAAHLDSCSSDERAELEADIADIDFADVQRFFKASNEPCRTLQEPLNPLDSGDVLTLAQRTLEEESAWRATGMAALAAGKAAVLMLAGGQGTRLGSSDPKGCFDIGLPSHKSLFQLHAEQIQRLQALATDAACEGSPAPELNSPSAAPAGKAECVRPIRWYIMTSAMTHTPTLAFFRAHTFFGLLESQVVFFQQGTLPCLSLTGSVVLASRTEVARAPDGNGGLYRALQASGALADMRAHGVESVDCVCVDNALARSGDPTFLGACLSRGVDWGARVVSKASATERVGVFARRGATVEVVEYSEIDPAQAAAVDSETGQLQYNWSSICMHFFSVAWLHEVADALSQFGRYHLARKQIPSLHGPAAGVKLELFIFDPFPLTTAFALLEVARCDEFAPVKNAEGAGISDTPSTARAAVLELHSRYLGSSPLAGDGCSYS